MNWYLTVLKKYAVFSGRARRKEYWMFILFNMIFCLIAMALDKILGIGFDCLYNTYGPIYIIYILAVFIPGLAVVVRRLHDIGKSGWMYLICFIPIVGAIWILVLLVKDSDQGENKYGANPKEIVEANL